MKRAFSPSILILLFLSMLCVALSASPPASDRLAGALAAQAYTALTSGLNVTDVTLTTTATQTDGPVSTVVLKALGTDSARIDVFGGQNLEIRTASSGTPQGIWTGTDGTAHPEVLHNCLTDAAWFFPVFSSVFGPPQNVSLSYIGLEELNGAKVQHIQVTKIMQGQSQSDTNFIASLSAMDVYLDSVSMLPLAVRFNIHPDDDAGTNIAVEVDFSSYTKTNGIQMPLHIQKYVQGTLTLDLVVTNLAINSGLTLGDFQVQ
jgi:hypothetical protein